MSAVPCTDAPDDWFTAATKETAKTACGRCPVRDACLELALAGNEQWGVWGGLDPEERAALTEDPDALPGMPSAGEVPLEHGVRASYSKCTDGDAGRACPRCAAVNASYKARWERGEDVSPRRKADDQQMTFDLEAIA